MDFLRTVPAVFSIIMALIVALFDLLNGIELKNISIRMSFVAFIFFFIGRAIRKVFLNTLKEIEKKKEEQERMKKLKLEEERKAREKEDSKYNKRKGVLFDRKIGDHTELKNERNASGDESNKQFTGLNDYLTNKSE